MIAESQAGTPSAGKGAPDSSQSGIRKTVMMAWKPCVDSIRQAMQNIHEATQQAVASTRKAEGAARDLNALGAKLLALTGGDGRGHGRGAA